ERSAYMAFLRMSGLALAAVVGLSLPIGQATAMPASGLAVAVKQVPKRVEDVRLVCGHYRCWSTGWGWRRPLLTGAGAGLMLTGAGAGLMLAGAGAGLMLTGAGAGLMLTGAGVDPSTFTPDPVGVGADPSMWLAKAALRLRRTCLGLAQTLLRLWLWL